MKLRHIAILLYLLLGFTYPLVAQERESVGFDIEHFKEKRAEFLVSEIGLGGMEAQRFVILANELLDKRFTMNKSFRIDTRAIRRKKNKTDTDYEKLVQQDLDLKTKELELEKEYYSKFRAILSPEKIYKYQQAEAKFMKRFIRERNTNSTRTRVKH